MALRPPRTETVNDPRPLRPAERWALLALRLAMICLVAWIAIELPMPVLEDWLAVKDVTVAVAAIILSGKVLFDTLFYDHYWP
jgi:hypothetical protein